MSGPRAAPDLRLLDRWGRAVTLRDLAAGHPAVLVFLRWLG
jgi:hypothetical protein